jgi:hypothetical protein
VFDGVKSVFSQDAAGTAAFGDAAAHFEQVAQSVDGAALV